MTVTLWDLVSNVIASTTTRRDGSYRFDGVDLGSYRVQLSLPPGLRQTSRTSREISVTRGGYVGPLIFGVRPRAPVIAPPIV